MTNKSLIRVVDDSPTQALAIRSLLEDRYHVVTAANGLLALSSIRQRLPDLIVADLQMSEMDGLELVDAI